MKQLKLVAEPSKGKGWARLSLTDCEAFSGSCGLAISRPGHKQPFLGPAGWQVSDSRLLIEVQQWEGTDVSLLVSPAIVQHLDAGSNYKFQFFNTSGDLVGDLIIRWAGITYRPPKDGRAPIEITLFDPIESQGIFLGQLGQEQTAETYADVNLVRDESNFNTFVSDSSEFVSAPISTEIPIDPVSVRITVESENTYPHSAEIKVDGPDTYFDTRRSAVRIRCPNCSSEIIQGMTRCPFCLSQIAL
jgi:hypothetical protein